MASINTRRGQIRQEQRAIRRAIKAPTTPTSTPGRGRMPSLLKQQHSPPNPRPQAKPAAPAATSFGAAFRAARSQGAGTKFTWKGKVFSAVTAEDVSSGKFKKTKKGYVRSK